MANRACNGHDKSSIQYSLMCYASCIHEVLHSENFYELFKWFSYLVGIFYEPFDRFGYLLGIFL